MKIPEPKYVVGDYTSFCCCEIKPKEKTDCYFYHDEYHMGGHIPTCNYHNQLGYCPCDGCDKYIDSGEVYKGVKEYVNRNER